MKQIGSKGSGQGQFRGLFAIALDWACNVYASDLTNNCIQKFSDELNFICKFGTTGSGTGQMKNRGGVVVDESGRVFVIDGATPESQVFNSSGSYLGAWGSAGTGSAATLANQVVTAGSDQLRDCFYIKSPDRSSGIKVIGASAAAGSIVTVRGLLIDSDGELAIRADAVIPGGTSSVKPLAIGAASLDGGKYGNQDGVWGKSSGMSNMGLLVRTWGRVVSQDSASHSFVIDDGAGNTVRCVMPGTSGADPNWRYVCITGISSCEKVGEELHSLIHIRSMDDIQPM